MSALAYSWIILHYRYEKLQHSVSLRVLSPQTRLKEWKLEYCPARLKLSKLLGVGHGKKSQASPDVSGNKDKSEGPSLPWLRQLFHQGSRDLGTLHLCPCQADAPQTIVGSCLARGSACLTSGYTFPPSLLGMGLLLLAKCKSALVVVVLGLVFSWMGSWV